MKFDFSKSKDLQNKSSIKVDKLDILMKNVLYCTNQLDSNRNRLIKIDALLTRLVNNLELQKQVDDYFEDTKPDGT